MRRQAPGDGCAGRRARIHGTWGRVAICCAFCGVFTASARAASDPRVEVASVEPARNDTMIVCTLVTSGLPDPPSRETLESGLPSSVTLALTVLDVTGNAVCDAQEEVRIEPDLWEETLLLRTPLFERRASSIEEIAGWLARLGPIPVAPLAGLGGEEPFRIRVRLAVHPLAPAEIRRVRALFGGGDPEDDADRREVSIGFGSVLRYFLGKRPGEEWVADRTSLPFFRGSLPREP